MEKEDPFLAQTDVSIKGMLPAQGLVSRARANAYRRRCLELIGVLVATVPQPKRESGLLQSRRRTTEMPDVYQSDRGAAATDLTILALIPRRSSRERPGFLGTR